MIASLKCIGTFLKIRDWDPDNLIIFLQSTQIPSWNQSVSESALVPGTYPTLHGNKNLSKWSRIKDSTLLLFRFDVASGSEQRVLKTEMMFCCCPLSRFLHHTKKATPQIHSDWFPSQPGCDDAMCWGRSDVGAMPSRSRRGRQSRDGERRRMGEWRRGGWEQTWFEWWRRKWFVAR